MSSMKALAVFQTMRSNLARADSFWRNSVIDVTRCSGDLGFLGVKKGAHQATTHNNAVISISVALLYQALTNYQELVTIRPGLRDPDLEEFVHRIDGSYASGLRKIRDGVFHGYRSGGHRDARLVSETWNSESAEGTGNTIEELRRLLYEFTSKCFSGELEVWPLGTRRAVAELEERMRAEKPEIFARFENGDLGIAEYNEAVLEFMGESRTRPSEP